MTDFSHQIKREIAGNARTLYERCEHVSIMSGKKSIDINEINSLYQEWNSILPNHSLISIKKRISLDGFSHSSEELLKLPVDWPASHPLPTWVDDLEHLVRTIQKTNSKNSLTEDPVPFEQLLSPVVDYAFRQLGQKCNLQHLSETAIHSLKIWLLRKLSWLTSLPLHLEFTVFLKDNFGESDYPKKSYGEFINMMKSKEIINFFREYSVLARLIARTVNFWVRSTEEFISRLNSDWELICKKFANTNDDIIQDVEFGAGDCHAQGRTTVKLSFKSDCKIIYKPRSTNLIKQFFNTIKIINEKYNEDLRILTVESRSGYGWVEMVESKPLHSIDSAKKYYRRIGILLFILHLYNASDLHYENLIAAGEQPVIVDLETISSPNIPIKYIPSEQAGLQTAKLKFQSSVLQTGLLPAQLQFPENQTTETTQHIFGLTATESQQTRRKYVSWTNVNTPEMNFTYESAKIQPSNNFPTFSGEAIKPQNYIEDIIDGFKFIYNKFISDKLTWKRNIMKRIEGTEVRCVIRSTSLYQALIDTITTPKYLRDGRLTSMKIDELIEAIVNQYPNQLNHLWPLYIFERKALFRLDIPRFTTYVDSETLYANEQKVIDTLFNPTGITQLKETFEQLGESDLNNQLGYIKASLNYYKNDNTHHWNK